MLCVWADLDDPTYRAEIAAATGGDVDYFDARFGTPSPSMLSTYDCIYAHSNYGWNNAFLVGDLLADYVDESTGQR
jgi:hypothetical protein